MMKNAAFLRALATETSIATLHIHPIPPYSIFLPFFYLFKE